MAPFVLGLLGCSDMERSRGDCHDEPKVNKANNTKHDAGDSTSHRCWCHVAIPNRRGRNKRKIKRRAYTDALGSRHHKGTEQQEYQERPEDTMHVAGHFVKITNETAKVFHLCRLLALYPAPRYQNPQHTHNPPG